MSVKVLCEISLWKPLTVDRISIVMNLDVVLKPALVKFVNICNSSWLLKKPNQVCFIIFFTRWSCKMEEKNCMFFTVLFLIYFFRSLIMSLLLVTHHSVWDLTNTEVTHFGPVISWLDFCHILRQASSVSVSQVFDFRIIVSFLFTSFKSMEIGLHYSSNSLSIP